MAIKAIVFDVGQIFQKKKIIYQKICEKYPHISLEDIAKAKCKYGLKSKFRTGKMSQEEYARRFFDNLGLKDAELLALTKKSSEKYPKVIEFARQLSKKYRIAALTNIGYGPRLEARKIMLKEIAEFVMASADAGASKPSKKAYQALLDKLKLKPAEVIFIDDKKRNIDGAKKLGIKGIVFKNLAQLKRDLEKLGVVA